MRFYHHNLWIKSTNGNKHKISILTNVDSFEKRISLINFHLPELNLLDEQPNRSINNEIDVGITAKGKSKGSLKEHWLHFEKNEVILLLSYFFFGLAFSNYEPYAPLWLNQFFNQDSFLIIGFVVIIPSLVGIIATPIWGYLADRFGSKKFVILGFISYSLMFLSLIFTTSSTFFLVIILIGYFFGSALTSNIFVLATKTSSKPREVVLAKFTMAVSLAYGIFSPIVGWIYDAFANSMIIQLSIAVGMTFLAVVLLFFAKDNEIGKSEEQVANSEPIKHKEVISETPFTLIGILVTAFLFQMGAGFWAYSSIYFLKTPQVALFNSANKGVIYSIFILIKTFLAVPLSFVFGRIKKQKNIGLIISCFTAYYVVVFILQTIFPTNWLMLLILYGFPMYPVYNVFFYNLVSRYSNDKRRGTAFGIFSAVGTIGYVSGILVIGAFADYVQIGTFTGIFVSFPVSLILAIVAFIAATILLLVRLRQEDDNFSSEEAEREEKKTIATE